jgi:hypothetical protein
MIEMEGKKMAQVYVGTLEEITSRYGKELAGRPLKVVVDDSSSSNSVVKPFYETATPEEWADALRVWATSHDPNTPFLSDEAIDRESIYEGRGE